MILVNALYYLAIFDLMQSGQIRQYTGGMKLAVNFERNSRVFPIISLNNCSFNIRHDRGLVSAVVRLEPDAADFGMDFGQKRFFSLVTKCKTKSVVANIDT